MIRRHLKAIVRRLLASGYRPLNRIEISRARLRHNVALIQSQHRGFTVIPVLKGNAYGHGIGIVAQALKTSRLLAVDGYHEAEQVHAYTNHRVLIMGYIAPPNVRLLDVRHCSYVVQDEAGLRAFGSLGKSVRVHLELNTGMNRLGLAPSELTGYLEVLKSYPKLELEGVMSHLADADNAESDDFTQHQVEAFDAQVEQILAAGFRPRYVHLAQTAGSTKVHSRYANAVRLGLGTYGINPLDSTDPQFSALQELKPALELVSTVIKVVELHPGDKVGYNCTFTATQPMRVGILPLGYYEGLPRALSGVGCVTSGGQALPIVGRVAMNHTAIDLTGTKLVVGDEVTVISADPATPNSLVSMQNRHGLFAYDTLAGLSSSVRRKLV